VVGELRGLVIVVYFQILSYQVSVSWYWGQDLNQQTHVNSDIHSVILWYGDFFIGTEYVDECTIVHRVKCCLIGLTF